MNLNIRSWFVRVFLCLFAGLVSVTAFADGGPVGMLQSVADNMIAGLKSNQATLKSKPQIVYKLAYRYVVPNSAIPEMAKRVLPPQTWNNATPAQREQFQKQFTTTLIRTYASSLTAYKDQTVKFYPVRGGSANSVTVDSDIISSENSPIRVTYRLIRVGGSWKLIDLSVEGVSMLESFRAQYSDILSQGSMEQLLQRMSSHNDRNG